MTLAVLRDAGIEIAETAGGFLVPGSQRYRPLSRRTPEADWSGATFWLAANAIGCKIEVQGLDRSSLQPDRLSVDALSRIVAGQDGEIDVSQFPDSFPPLCIAAACAGRKIRFTGTRRLKIKESDRVAAMGDVLSRFGARTLEGDGFFDVEGPAGGRLRGGCFKSFSDHRIAMAAAIGASRADSPVEIDDAQCAAKSYPRFFDELSAMERFSA